MDISIIIPSFNTKLLLERCLRSVFDSLTETDLRFEVLVVDNASTDGSCTLVRKKFPRVHIILNKQNVGYGKANNQAIKKATGTYVLLLNSDIIVQNNAIEALYSFIQKKEKAFAGGKLLNEDGSVQPSCGPFFSLPAVWLMLFAKGDHWGATRSSPQETQTVDWVSGACLIGRRSSFLDVGLFDERIFMYMDEVDFLFRARKRGYKTYFYPKAHFTHTGAASSGRDAAVLHVYRGLLYFYRKHRGPFAQALLRAALVAKALAAMGAGRMMGKSDLVRTYEKALAGVFR